MRNNFFRLFVVLLLLCLVLNYFKEQSPEEYTPIKSKVAYTLKGKATWKGERMIFTPVKGVEEGEIDNHIYLVVIEGYELYRPDVVSYFYKVVIPSGGAFKVSKDFTEYSLWQTDDERNYNDDFLEFKKIFEEKSSFPVYWF